MVNATQFNCVVNPSLLVIAWEVDGMRYGLDELLDGDLPGHISSGTNITVSGPVNGTKYVCVIPTVPPNPIIMSEPAFLYIASMKIFLMCMCIHVYNLCMHIYTCMHAAHVHTSVHMYLYIYVYNKV